MTEVTTNAKKYENPKIEPKVNHEPEPETRYVVDPSGCIISYSTYCKNPRAYAGFDR